MLIKDYQEEIRKRLEHQLGSESVCEWVTRMDANIYSPRLDVAVGPFSFVNGVQMIDEYDVLYDNKSKFLSKLVRAHLINLAIINQNTSHEESEMHVQYKMDELRYFNRNSRCFMAVEIENSVTRKHLMGGAINASALGRIGIAIGYTEEMHNAFLNLYRYFQFLESVDKPTFKTKNLLIISASQFMDICTEP